MFAGSDTSSTDSGELLQEYADYIKNLSYHRFCREANHNFGAYCGLQSYQNYRTEQRPEQDYNRLVQPQYPIIVDPVIKTLSGSADKPVIPVNQEPVVQVNTNGNRNPVNPDSVEDQVRGSDHELRRSAAERQFHYYTSWGRYDRSMYRTIFNTFGVWNHYYKTVF